MKKYLLSLTLLILCYSLNAQDTNIVKYLPLKVGNVWVYDRNQPPYIQPGPGKDLVKIEGSTVFNGNLYYTQRTKVYESNGSLYSNVVKQIRVDSLTGNVYILSGSDVCLSDSLISMKNDSAYITCESVWYRCTDTGAYSIFGHNTFSKSFFRSNFFEVGEGRTFAKYFGKVSMAYICPQCSVYWYLMGCVIDGVLYGDTSITSISIISSEVPKSISLSQNYPNPFNPVTLIKFEIPNSNFETNSKTEIRIYDVLGREISTIVNQRLSPGTYEVEFDGMNYPSGVYYYTLTSGDFKETKKMVLIK